MKVLVTVGTTPFDELIEAVDTGEHAHCSHLQIANGSYIPKSSEWSHRVEDFDACCAQADVVVCHSGAGSVFGLLQAGICPVVVPNLVRRDQHQVELGRWLERNRYAPVAWEIDQVNALISAHPESMAKCRQFDVAPFFYADELNDVIRSRLSL